MTFDLGVIRRQHLRLNQAKGGNQYVAGNYAVHSFTTTYTFTTLTTVQADVLLVAGGGGSYRYGAGGGAGGVVQGTYTFDPGTYTVTIGSGGVGYSQTTGYTSNGGNSSIVGPNLNLVALGGGKAGSNGGSGGSAGLALQPSSASGGLGNNGSTTSTWASGAGGGAGGPGLHPWRSMDTSAGIGGQGGVGIASDISGTLDYYAGGGGGRAYIYAAGYDGPYYGWAANAPAPSYTSESRDVPWINGHSITDRYNPQPFTVTINLPSAGNYTIKWYTVGINNFSWVLDGIPYYNSSSTSVVKGVRYLTLSLSDGSHSLTLTFDSVNHYDNNPNRYFSGSMAWGIYDSGGNQIWNTRERSILTGGSSRYGGGGSANDPLWANNGGQGIAIIRYINV